nr:hirudin variant HV3-1 [Whitmania pigra]
MFSLKLFVVLLAVCICMSQAQSFTTCTRSSPNTPCLCEGDDICGEDKICELGDDPSKNECVEGISPGTQKIDSNEEYDAERVNYDFD